MERIYEVWKKDIHDIDYHLYSVTDDREEAYKDAEYLKQAGYAVQFIAR